MATFQVIIQKKKRGQSEHCIKTFNLSPLNAYAAGACRDERQPVKGGGPLF